MFCHGNGIETRPSSVHHLVEPGPEAAPHRFTIDQLVVRDRDHRLRKAMREIVRKVPVRELLRIGELRRSAFERSTPVEPNSD